MKTPEQHRAELERKDSKALMEDVANSKRLAKHPFATNADVEDYRLRIRIAEDILLGRVLQPFQGPPAKAPRDEVSEPLELPRNRNSEIDSEEHVLALVRGCSEQELERRLARVNAKLRHPHLERGSETHKRLQQDASDLHEALRRVRDVWDGR